MSDRIEETRARLLAADEGYPVHVGCGGEVGIDDRCASCNARLRRQDIALPSDLALYAGSATQHLLAEIDRLTAELAEARGDFKRATDAAMDAIADAVAREQERDAAIRERDARPAISREDAATWSRCCVDIEEIKSQTDYEVAVRVESALRAHAAGVDAPRVDAVCEECEGGVYPYYGGAPGRDYAGPSEEDFTYTDRDGRMHTIPAGAFIFAQRDPAPRETWPANFAEDPDCPGLGTWSCPKCTEAPRVDAPRVDAVCVECEGEGRVETQEQYEDGSYGRTLVFDVCPACKGKGRTEAPRVDVVCAECEGRGHLSRDEWSEDAQAHAAGVDAPRVDAPRVDAVCAQCGGEGKRWTRRGTYRWVCPACNGTGRTEAAKGE